jgi:hypothetical protein
MDRKILAFFLLCLCFITRPTFAADVSVTGTASEEPTAALTRTDQLRAIRIYDQVSRGKEYAGKSMDYMSPNQFVGTQVGLTNFDLQHYGSMGRQVAIGSSGRVHFDWTYLESVPGTVGIRYNAMVFDVSSWELTFGPSGVDITPSGGSFCQMGEFNNLGVAAYHRWNSGLGAYTSWASVDYMEGMGLFSEYSAPNSMCPDIPNGVNEGNYIWPTMDVETHQGLSFTVHMVSTEQDEESEISSLVYYRATGSSFGDGMFGECGQFIDSVAAVSAVVCADRNSDRVAIVYSKSKYMGPGDFMPFASYLYNDIAYVESYDDGVTFGPVNMVTDYPDEDSMFALSDISALYTSDGALHIAWNTGWAWPDEYGADMIWYNPSRGDIYHWDDMSQIVSLVTFGRNIHLCGNSEPDGLYNRNVAKQSLIECSNGSLYITYTWFSGDAFEGTDDCSANGYANGDIYSQASTTGGITWGPPVNLTNTATPGCTAGTCESEHWASAAAFADSLYILYVGDRDAGGWAEGGEDAEGEPTENPVMMYVHPCFDMETYVELEVNPGGFLDPFHRASNEPYDTSFVVTNLGNTDAMCTLTENPSVGWMAADPYSFNISPAIDNSQTVQLFGTAPSVEGLYTTDIQISFNDMKGLITVPVQLYVFNDFFIPEDAAIRTASNQLIVSQVSRVAHQTRWGRFTWFGDGNDYLFDGSLVLGYDSDHMFTNIYYQLGDTVADDNPLRELRALSPTYCDSTSYSSYRYAEGYGCTADSTVAFRSQFWASKHPDSAGFYVGRFSIYAGPNQTVGVPVENLVVGYAADWDIPSDTGRDNFGLVDDSLQLVYLQGAYPGSPDINDTRYGGVAFRGNDAELEFATAGWYWENDSYVLPTVDNLTGGFHADSLYKYMSSATGWGPIPEPGVADSVEDLGCMITVSNDAALTWTAGVPDSLIFYIIFAGSNDGSGPKSESDLKTSVEKSEKFICNHINADAPFCVNCSCGDADGNGVVNISDAVYLIEYLFLGGDPPDPTCGETDGYELINLHDAMQIVAFYFGAPIELICPATAPPCNGNANSDFTFRYTSVLPANASSADIEVYFDCHSQFQSITLPVAVRVEGEVPTVDAVDVDDLSGQLANGGTFNVTGAPLEGTILMYVISLGAVFPPQCAHFATIHISIPPEPVCRVITLLLTEAPPLQNGEYVNYPQVTDANSDCWAPVLVGSPFPDCGGFDCSNSYTDPVFIACPGGDASFQVYLRDALGYPLVCFDDVWLEFQGCEDIVLCPDEPGGTTLQPYGPSDEEGIVRFSLAAGNCTPGCEATVRTSSCDIGTVPVRSVDINGNLIVELSADYDSSSCNDYNDDGQIDYSDMSIFSAHLGHNCSTTSCERFGYDFQVTPPTDLFPGQIVNLDLVLTNNNYDYCDVDSVFFLASGFGAGQDEILLEAIPYSHQLAPGERDTISTSYEVPGVGQGCLIARFATDCCSTTVEVMQCAQSNWYCTNGEGSNCYQYVIELNGNPIDSIVKIVYLPSPGWYSNDVSVPSLPLYGAGVMIYEICTPGLPELGDTAAGCIYVYANGGTQPTILWNRVVVTSRTGDADGNCITNISDVVYLIAYIFGGGPGPLPYLAGDVDCNTIVNIADAVYLIAYIFGGGPPPCLVGD